MTAASALRVACAAALLVCSSAVSAMPAGRPTGTFVRMSGHPAHAQPVQDRAHRVRMATAYASRLSKPHAPVASRVEKPFSMSSAAPLLRNAKAVLFDLDGTIADTSAQLHRIIALAAADVGLNPTKEEIEPLTHGIDPEHAFALLRPNATADETSRFVAAWQTHDVETQNLIGLYPGMRDALVELRATYPKARLAIATARPTWIAKKILERIGASDLFDVIEGTGGTNLPRKPAPDLLLKIATMLGVDPRDAVMIGDMPTDLQAGKRAGMATAAVTHGFGNREALAREKPALMFHGFASDDETRAVATSRK